MDDKLAAAAAAGLLMLGARLAAMGALLSVGRAEVAGARRRPCAAALRESTLPLTEGACAHTQVPSEPPATTSPQ